MGVIHTFVGSYRLFKQPKRVGETIESDGKMYLLLGIQRFTLRFNTLTVWYTCQDLTSTDYVTDGKLYIKPRMAEADAKVKHDDESKIDKLSLGTVHLISGQHYQIVEYTDILLIGTDIQFSFYVKPLYPIDRKEARGKYLNERRKKLSLEVV